MGGLFGVFRRKEKTLLDQYVSCESETLPDGRPSITMWYDRRTGEPYGFGYKNPAPDNKNCASVRLIGASELPEYISPQVIIARNKFRKIKDSIRCG